MPWIACDVTLPKNPKTLDLSDLMGWNPKEAVGCLLTLWGWCLEFADDGDLTNFKPGRIAQGMGLPPEKGEIVIAALLESKWVDGTPYLRIHNWWSMVGMFLKGRYSKNPKRWKRIRRLYEPDASDTEDEAMAVAARSGPDPDQAPTGSGPGCDQVQITEHNNTVHNSTVQNSTEHLPLRPLQRSSEKSDDDGDGGGDFSLIRELEFSSIKREIIRGSGIQRISESDEQKLLRLHQRYGSELLDACQHLHGGIRNVPAYLTSILEQRAEINELIRRGVAE